MLFGLHKLSPFKTVQQAVIDNFKRFDMGFNESCTGQPRRRQENYVSFGFGFGGLGICRADCCLFCVCGL
jgi:hypothetical protein